MPQTVRTCQTKTDIKVEREPVEMLEARCPILAKHLTTEGVVAIVTVQSKTAAAMYYEYAKARRFVSGSRCLFERYEREVEANDEAAINREHRANYGRAVDPRGR